MRRGRRERIDERNSLKRLFYLSIGFLIVILLVFAITFIVYNNKLKQYSYSSYATERIADLIPNNELSFENTQTASTEIGKSIEEVIQNMENEVKENSIEEEPKEEIVENKQETLEPEEEIVQIKEPEFIMPVEGEISRGFAKDSLVYSNTLEEWVTHLGIDIKAERTSIVKAAEGGEIVAIKNDPRYGLTIIIDHGNGYKSIYSNLLTTEFVSEGERVEKGQSIATVGNSAAFEIVDEAHLHFEILKDDVQVDPNIYLK